MQQKWHKKLITKLLNKDFFQLVLQAHKTQLKNFGDNKIEFCSLHSIKTGTCPEDCAYCPQSGHFNTEVKKEKIQSLETVINAAKQAKAKGAERFCFGAAWRSPPHKDMTRVIAIIKAIKEIGLESCATLGMLTKDQAEQLKQAGLDYYNHNLDTSPNYYQKIISTRTYQNRIDTINNVINAGIKVCCGGILSMGETRDDRIELLLALTKLSAPPQSIPINQLIPIPGTPLAQQKPIDNFEFIRTIAAARIIFPSSRIRLAAGRENMSEEMQALCFFAGVNSIFLGDILLTANNQSYCNDLALLKKLDLNIPQVEECQA